MKSVLREVSLLLDQFQRSEWRDLHVRTERYALFMAKTNGGANPMLGAPAVVIPQRGMEQRGMDEQPTTTAAAPHLGTVHSIAAAGSEVHVGMVIARLEVLGAIEDVVSREAGVVQEVMSPAGTLVEFETPLLRIVQRTTPLEASTPPPSRA